mgnify:CR=1 FL=1
MAERTDDGRRYMPKMKCPYGNHRFADVPDLALRNDSELKRLSEAANIDYILECPRCHQKVALSIRVLRTRSTNASKTTETQIAL